MQVAKSVLASACALWVTTAFGADVTVGPQADLRVEQNDNFNLVPGGSPDSDVAGYIADMSVLFDIRTPRGQTEIRPRLKAQEYPDREDFEKLEWFFDMNSTYRWERSEFDLLANYSRQDVYNSETPSGDFDPLDPGGSPDSGEIVIGEVRSAISVQPRFEHRITERAGIGVSADIQLARYDAPQGFDTRTDYDYGVLEGFWSWALDPNTDLTFGAYGSRFEAKDDSEEDDGLGGRIGIAHRFNETDGISANVFYERNEATQFVPVLAEETTSDFGGEFTVFRTLQVSDWRLTLGKSFIPTGDSGKAESDYARAQYVRQLSERLTLRLSGRYDSRSALGELGGGQDRDYARGDVSMRWFVTPTWYVGGGYAYIWEDREQAVGDAANNKFYINFGYRALNRRNQRAISDD